MGSIGGSKGSFTARLYRGVDECPAPAPTHATEAHPQLESFSPSGGTWIGSSCGLPHRHNDDVGRVWATTSCRMSGWPAKIGESEVGFGSKAWRDGLRAWKKRIGNLLRFDRAMAAEVHRFS
jgi:hypothetical protein